MKSQIKFLRLTFYGPWTTPCQESTPTPSKLLVFSLLEVLRFGLSSTSVISPRGGQENEEKKKKMEKSCFNPPILHTLEWSKKSARIMELYIYIKRVRLHVRDMRWRLEHLLYYWSQKTTTNCHFGDPDPHSHGMVRILIFNGSGILNVPKIRFMYSQKWNCAASFTIPTFLFLWAAYIFSGRSAYLAAAKISRSFLGIYKSITDTWMWKLRDRTL